MKKVLAWAVVLALVLSSFTMAFADQAKTSKDFKDASEINYTEAVDVMVATGIINGYPDGTFGPAKTVKRSEMAKMIACIMNGGEDVGDQYKSACPFADSQGHWAAGYIAYCASEHIIDGRSADVFDPEAEVTGTEVAKMALTSLGYDSKIQGYTGENWAANVLKDAKKNDLFKGLDKSFVPGDPCNRESAAQILFNMLKAAEVEYDTNMSIETGDTSISVNSKAQKVEATEAEDDNGDGFLNLYEDVFGGALSQNEQDSDESGRPAHSWTFDGDDVGTYADSASYEFTVADAESIEAAVAAYDEDLAEELADYDFEVVVNGGQGEIALGDKVELFVEDESVLAVVTQYLPARIESVDTDVSDEDAEDGITAYLTFEGAIDEADSDMAGYDESTYVEGAVIAVCIGEDGIMDSYVMEEAAKGEVTKIGRDGKITIDGKAYETTGASYVAFDKPVAAEKDTVFVLYDYNGYVLASAVEEEAAAETEEFYGVLMAWGEKANQEYWSDADSNYTVMLKIFTAEGKVEVINLSDDFEATDEPDTFSLIKYTLNEDGEIDTFTAADADEFDKPMKAGGTLNGYEVSEDVVAFYTPWEYGDNSSTPVYDVEEWVVYDYAALEEADSIPVELSFKDGDNAYAALQLDASLEETPEPEIVFGFVSGYEAYTTADGEFADVTVWVAGKEVSYTTAEEVFTPDFAGALEELAADDLVMITLDGDGNISEFNADLDYDLVGAPAEEFEGDAAMYDPAETDSDAVADENGYVVVSGATSSALQFGDAKIDKQNVSKATVYLLKEDALSVSSAGKIKPANNAAAKIYQIDAESGVWNIVVYVNGYETAPADTDFTVTWELPNYCSLYYNDVRVNWEGDDPSILPATAKAGDEISFRYETFTYVTPIVKINGVQIENPTPILDDEDGDMETTYDQQNVYNFTVTVEGDTAIVIDYEYDE